MGLPFHFAAGEGPGGNGPKIEKPVRTSEDVARLRTDRAADLGYVSEAVTTSSPSSASAVRLSRSPAT